MNDPLRPKDKPEPRRAEPIHPDAPVRDSTAAAPTEPTTGKESLDRAMEQEQTALDNVRDT